MQAWTGLITLAFTLPTTWSFTTSPCPSFFQYVSEQPGQWRGDIVLQTKATIRGICIKLTFDTFPLDVRVDGDLYTLRDNYHSVYDLVNYDLILYANVARKFEITVRHDETRGSKLVGFQVNGRTLCPENIKNVNPVKGDGNKPSNENPAVPNTQNIPTNRLEPDCGVVPLHPGNFTSQRIHEGQFPWHGYVYYVDKTQNTTKKLCSATLISSNLVLTAAHCLLRKTGDPLRRDDLRINLGEHFTISRGRGVQVARIAKVAAHPRFNRISWDNDIAIVKLDRPVTITDYVRPVCLWEDPGRDAPNEGLVTGIGIDSDGRSSDSLMFAKLLISNRTVCLTKNPNVASTVSSKSLCSSYEKGNTICVGEPGAGVVTLKSVWQLRALVSVGPENTKECNENQYVYLTDVTQYLAWIKTAFV